MICGSGKTMQLIASICLLMCWVSALPAKQDSNCDCVCGVRGRANRIVGGGPASPHEFPWLVGLSRQGRLYCGASIISARHILTAAHCVNGLEANEIKVYLGGHNITADYTEIRRVKQIYEHENFDVISFNNDIAVLELDKPLLFGPKVQPACLPDGSLHDFAGKLTVIAGWGRTGEKEKTSNGLMSVVIPVWTKEQCLDSEYGSKRITDNMMCAGYHDGLKDACQGDSGGPMHMEGVTGSMEVIGIVSWGRGCARPNLPGIYTRVVNYLPWIKKKLGKQCLCSPRAGQRTNYLESAILDDLEAEEILAEY